ncbi:holin [Staphylococcus carnosus]|uniref:Holin n=2 Tax=Staphylococcus carnosus TaxID=1281 RepID=A0AAJ0JQI4_STACA|nr:holin [Staphylococcus carnosus]KKB25885.1 holin [Staphylococcus carnosus]KOR13019.1 holin [Staphylococcus carnosus]POA06224.1 CidA/LrgA family protein [Staphylococcus carnosus]UTB77479.1 holin [Staphylococcus carnosus]
MLMTIRVLKIIFQALLIYGITLLGNAIQHLLHIPLAGSIVGLGLFFLLLQFKIIPVKWVKDGANFLLTTMVFFFIPSVVGVMDIVSDIHLNFIVFFAVIILGTIAVAFTSGLIAEKMAHRPHVNKGHHTS